MHNYFYMIKRGLVMPAKRGKNFRSGDLAEQLGIYLLQSVALVAPIPRTEDVGIDVVCTLISDYNQFSYLAEDSFYVQVKSNGVKEIEYSDIEVDWLTNLKLPFFIAVVDKLKTKVSLYTCKRLYDAIAVKKDRSSIRLILADNEADNVFDLVEEKETDIYLGIPIVEWSIADLMNKELNVKTLFFNIMKEHVRIIHEAMELYVLGCGMSYVWKTNEIPEKIGAKACGALDIPVDELHGKMMSYLIKSLEVSMRTHDFGMIDEAEALIKEYRELNEKFQQMLEGTVEKNDDDSDI